MAGKIVMLVMLWISVLQSILMAVGWLFIFGSGSLDLAALVVAYAIGGATTAVLFRRADPPSPIYWALAVFFSLEAIWMILAPVAGGLFLIAPLFM